MRNKENEKYIKLGITGSAVVIVGLLSYFFLVGMQHNGGALGAIATILKPFIYGVIIAYIVTPMTRKLERTFKGHFKGKKSGRLAESLAIGLAVLIEVLIVMSFILLIIPQLISSISRLADVLPGQIAALRLRVESLLEDPPTWLAWAQNNFGDLNERLNTWLKSDLPSLTRSVLASAAPKLAGAFGIVYRIVYQVLIGQIVAIYLLARRKQLAAQAALILRGTFKTEWADWIEGEVHVVDRMFNGFFMGKLLDSAIIGVLCFFGSLIMRFESPVLIAVIVGVTNIIPFFGPFIGAVPCALLLLLEDPVHCLMFILFVIILQQLDGNVIGPRILGNTTGLSGLWVMFGILLFGGLWGVGGMIVGVPLTAVIYDVARQLVFQGVRKHGRDDILDEYNEKYHPKGN